MNDFDAKLNVFFGQLDDKFKRVFPNMVAETAVEHFKENFKTKSFDGKPWPAFKNKAREPRRGSLMMRSNALFASIKPKLVTAERVIISAGGSRVPYARVHNEGGAILHKPRQVIITHKVHTRGKHKGKTLFAKNNQNASYSQRATRGAYTQNMPQRQFMGKSQMLLTAIKNRFKTL